LDEAVPVYETFKAWDDDISGARSFGDLPEAARDYVRYVEREAGAEVGLIGVGPDREDTIFKGF
jgi:adenylosuccinate synthase